ncbi:Flp family type IVb pilin [Alsobacter soli]|uniref:Flp family type IVb pilin n=1 Tax=Alsobacter soli TaxID=2109933 RepID=A0A2T1HSJ9_9HYPH|nr:Flp family type IVb pilin [Alsobacter soli]PSC04625.1 Flp family type IVb pilin [Alsobacter soli]
MRRLLNQFATDDRGATAIEYGLIAAIISLVIIGGSGSIRSALWDTFNTILTRMAAAT